MIATYILKGQKDFFYCGITADLNLRLTQHNAGKSISTKHFAPLELLFQHMSDNRKLAHAFEKQIKNAGVKKWYFKNVANRNTVKGKGETI